MYWAMDNLDVERNGLLSRWRASDRVKVDAPPVVVSPPSPRPAPAGGRGGKVLALLALFVFALFFTFPVAAADDAADIRRVEQSLNSFETLQTRFTQIASNGQVSEGELYIRRPGRMRLAYKPPVPLLVIADGTWLVVYDVETKHADRYPLASTAMRVLVQRDVKLGDRLAVKMIERGNGILRATVFDRERPADGQITLVFEDLANRLVLRQWEVLDAQNLLTRVMLGEPKVNIALDAKLFVFNDDRPLDPTRPQ
jgi:outer membrane lipoprotein-sorting protein